MGSCQRFTAKQCYAKGHGFGTTRRLRGFLCRRKTQRIRHVSFTSQSVGDRSVSARPHAYVVENSRRVDRENLLAGLIYCGVAIQFFYVLGASLRSLLLSSAQIRIQLLVPVLL